MDEIDQAADFEEMFLGHAIKQARTPLTFVVGVCHNCDAPLPNGMGTWCDSACVADWEKRMKILNRKGEA